MTFTHPRENQPSEWNPALAMTSTAPTSLAISDRRLLTADDAPDGSYQSAWNGWLDRLVTAGVEALQIREKDLQDGPLSSLVRRTVQHLARHANRPRVLVNGRLDIALAGGADGVHLTSQSVPLPAILEQVERLRGPAGNRRFLVGCSTHTAHEVRRAASDGADYVVFGPLFPTPSKVVPTEVPGIDGLRQISQLGIPVLALGGITQPHHVARAVRAGAHGVAAIRGFLQAPSRLVLALEAERAKEDEGPAACSTPGGDNA